MKQGLRAVAVVALLGLHPAIAAATVWNVVSDFSISSNPNGAWAYGRGAPAGGTPEWDFVPLPYTSTFSQGPTDFWERTAGGAPPRGKGTIPIVGENMGAAYNFETALVLPGVLWLHPGSVLDVLVQWKAPTAGSYSYSGEYELLDTHPTGVIGQVFENATELYSRTLTGPGANQSTMTPGESETFGGTVSLLAGQTLTFAVNKDGNYDNDSTGLIATITSNGLTATIPSSIPEPSTWAMMLLGFAGLSFAACRRTITTSAATALAAVVRFA